MRRRRGCDERGAAIIFMALSMTIVLMAAAFAVDYGYWYLRVQQAQRAAQAGQGP